MFTQIFDTHSHYTDSAFDADRHEVLSALPEAGIVHAVLAGTTLEDSTAQRQLHELIAAMDTFPAMSYIVTLANADAGGRAINAIWQNEGASRKNWLVVPSLGMRRYLSALKGAEMVPEDKVLIIYDRAVLDDKAYISDAQFAKTLAHFGKTEQEVLAGYDAVLHLVTCAKGAEFAYNYGNAARYETVEVAREKDDLTLRAWSTHPAVYVIDNSVNFEDKIDRAIAQIYRIIGQAAPEPGKKKYLVAMPDCAALEKLYGAAPAEMMQTYLVPVRQDTERRIRQQKNGSGYLYFYTEKRIAPDGTRWVTEKPISEKEYVAYLMEADVSLHSVIKQKYSFTYDKRRMELDVYPFSSDKAILFAYGSDTGRLPPEIKILKDVTREAEYKNRALAGSQRL